MAMEKEVQNYTGLYRQALQQSGAADAETRAQAYAERLAALYASPAYAQHAIYPTMDTAKVYAVIAMCLECKERGQSREETIDLVNTAFEKRKKLFCALEKLIDATPLAWPVAKKWNLSDHESRVKDGSIQYEFFNVEDGKISYRIVGCAYVEMFRYYGIREYCKIFCMTDTQAYSNLTRHVKFVRQSDLSDGEACRDDILRR